MSSRNRIHGTTATATAWRMRHRRAERDQRREGADVAGAKDDVGRGDAARNEADIVGRPDGPISKGDQPSAAARSGISVICRPWPLIRNATPTRSEAIGPMAAIIATGPPRRLRP